MPKIIKDGITYGAAPSSEVWEGTQAQYDALTTKDPDVTYFITDSDPAPATNAAVISYDNTDSGLYAINVQSAIDELSGSAGYSTSGLTYNSDFTYISGGYVKMGKLVVVNIRGYTTASIATNTPLVSGFPPVAISTNTVCVSNNRSYDITLTSPGNITTNIAISSQIALLMSATYVTT